MNDKKIKEYNMFVKDVKDKNFFHVHPIITHYDISVR